jgi:ABC-type transporter Mla subunit MlaD
VSSKREVKEKSMTTKPEPSGGVKIGDVTGGIQGSIIAGRDVRNATITLGGEQVPADKEPTVDELRQLLTEIREGLAEITAQQDTLAQVSAAAPYTAQGAEQAISEAAQTVEQGTQELEPEEAESVQERLKEATSLLGTILDGAKTVAKKTGEVVGAVQPLAEKLEPLVEKIGVAVLWVAKLWLLKGNP